MIGIHFTSIRLRSISYEVSSWCNTIPAYDSTWILGGRLHLSVTQITLGSSRDLTYWYPQAILGEWVKWPLHFEIIHHAIIRVYRGIPIPIAIASLNNNFIVVYLFLLFFFFLIFDKLKTWSSPTRKKSNVSWLFSPMVMKPPDKSTILTIVQIATSVSPLFECPLSTKSSEKESYLTKESKKERSKPVYVKPNIPLKEHFGGKQRKK